MPDLTVQNAVQAKRGDASLLHFMFGFDEYLLDPAIVTPTNSEQTPYFPEIEAIRTGDFVDMNGNPVTIDIALLDTLVENFDNNTAGQDIPIDIDHERAEAAGWLVGVRRLNNSLFVAPNWNDYGLDLVRSKRYRYVSCTINLTAKYLVSVSLTNFPAVSGLRPIELSRMNEGASSSIIVLFQTPEESMDKLVQKDALPAESITTPPAEPSTPAAPVAPSAELSTGKPDRDAVVAQFRAEADAEIAAIRKELNDLVGDLKAQRQQAVADFMRQVRDERAIAEFSERVTSTGRHAIPAKPDDVVAVLSALPPANREAVQKLLESIYANGTVDFSEVGTSAGKSVVETVSLSAEWQGVLASHIKAGGTVDQFFEINADLLGDKSCYNLSAYAKEAK